MPDDDTETHTVYDLIVTSLIVIGITVNVYLIVDQATDGALSNSITDKASRFISKTNELRKREAHIKRDIGRVVWQATRIVETEGMEAE